MNNQPNEEERHRMVDDALKHLKQTTPQWTHEELLSQRARDIASEVNAVFRGMQEIHADLVVSKRRQREELGQLFADRYRAEFDKEELVFLLCMMTVEAIIDQF